ncbi:hypothetical protein AWB80_03326 [Caballeronia pedi]|uniref:Uncharacterized protein n=1 Tax=Caballeronia pedi TaxID=1777141 RepID=A0A158BCM0_9BURK|nr:hypothetical protein [Caballeronia pedi]SAK67630.1 hypothetical protein AWB80_03326 [Caballeronia pedi]
MKDLQISVDPHGHATLSPSVQISGHAANSALHYHGESQPAELLITH